MLDGAMMDCVHKSVSVVFDYKQPLARTKVECTRADLSWGGSQVGGMVDL